jgi:hypothetical protein
MATEQETCLRIVDGLKSQNPGKQFAFNDTYSAIGCWCDHLKRFVRCAMIGLDGKWYHVGYDIRVNGQVPSANWIAA